jgi:surface polysaccharide O-acyltransferase-like enzyme
MSDQPQKPLWQTVLISLVMTSLLAGIAWAVWTYANTGVHEFAPGTLLRDLRFFIGLLAVFLVLSLLDRIVEFVKAKLGSGH